MEEKTTNIKLEPQPISEVEIDSNHLATIMYKNNLAIYVMAVISIVLIITLNIWGYYFWYIVIGSLPICHFQD